MKKVKDGLEVRTIINDESRVGNTLREIGVLKRKVIENEEGLPVYLFFNKSHFICNRERYVRGGWGTYKHVATPFGEMVNVTKEEFDKALKETMAKCEID
jgi:hypothetical protein